MDLSESSNPIGNKTIIKDTIQFFYKSSENDEIRQISSTK
jgi:hypothetical protein